MEKTCRRCLTVKVLDEFYVHSRMADGHLNICKECVKRKSLEYRELNLEKVRTYDRSRKKHGNNKNYPKHQKDANRLVYRAIQRGLLKKHPCVICGKSKAEAHHQDYNKPYDVIWLCPEHHRRLHFNRFSLIPTTKTHDHDTYLDTDRDTDRERRIPQGAGLHQGAGEHARPMGGRL